MISVQSLIYSIKKDGEDFVWEKLYKPRKYDMPFVIRRIYENKFADPEPNFKNTFWNYGGPYWYIFIFFLK